MITAITTSPRSDGVLTKCVHSLELAGQSEVRVFAEPNSDVGSNCDITILRDRRFGAWHNWLSMCHQLLAESTADVILTVQDDVVFSATAMTKLERLWPANTADVGFVSLYTPSHYQRKFIVKNSAGRALKHFPDHASAERYANRIRQRRRGFNVEEYRWPDGLNRVTTRSLWGACALAFPRESLRRIIEHPIAKNWQGVGKTPREPADIANVDTAIGKICNALGLGMYFVNPSLAQHIGAESTLGHGGLGGRRQALYVADDLKDAIPPAPATQSFIPSQSPYLAPCRHLGRVLGRTACSCGSTGPDVEVRECLAGHGRDITLRDDPTTHVSACQTDNHQRPLSGKWPLPKLPSCSTCTFREQVGADVSPITIINDTMPQIATPTMASGSRTRHAHTTQTSCRVSVAIICHNYGRFLDECIDSVAASVGVVLHEVFVVDDSSTDDTAAVCTRRDMRRIHVEHRHVHESRRTAYEQSTGDVLLFLDADDCLATTYIADACHLFESDPSVGIVYSDCEHFGDRTGRTSFPETFDADQLFLDNYIHAGSLVRRDALRTADAFAQPATTNTHADWTIWKRIVRHGWRAAKQHSMYRYRKHGSSMLKTTIDAGYYERADLGREPVTVFVPLSGRSELWPRFSAQLESLEWPAEQLSLILFDTSQDATFGRMVDHWIAGHRFTGGPEEVLFGDIRHVRQAVGPKRIANVDRRKSPLIVESVRQAVAKIYNWMRANVSTQYVMILEDDNFPKSPKIIEQLLRGFDFNVVSVAAPYLSAYGPRYPAWSNLDGDSQSFFGERGSGRQVIGGNGFGCVMLRKIAIREHHFTDATHPPSGVKSADYDIDFYQRIRRYHPQWKCLLDWSIECDHIQRVTR